MLPNAARRHRRASPASSRALLVALLAVPFGLAAALRAEAATYYVDNQSANCSNTGAGTEAQPYCTIGAAVAARGGPGTTIVVKPGVYREQVTVSASGASGMPFVIRAQGPGVVIDGSDSFASASAWVASTGTVFRASSVTWSPQQVFVDGVRLILSTAAPESLAVNAFRWVSGQGLYVNLGGGNPGLRQTLVGRRAYGMNMSSKSWITIEGLEILRSDDRGIYVQTGCRDIVIARNQIRYTRSYGMQTAGGINILIDGNTVSDCGYHGIGLTGGATGCTVRNNESYRNVDPNIRRANGIYMHGATANTLYGNDLHDNQDTGMQFSGGANDNFAFNNRSWNNGDHGYDHLGATGNIHIHDLASGNYKDGFSVEGNSPNTRLHNCISVNNGLTTDQFNLWVDDLSSVGFVSDRNIFWNSTSQPPIKYIATKYATLAGYQAASGQDANSRQADPRFANGATGNFNLLAGSPAIDAATSNLPNWPATDVMGRARIDDPATANTGAGPVTYADIGPFEFVAAPDRAPVVSCPGAVTAAPGATVSFTVTAADPDGHPITSFTMIAPDGTLTTAAMPAPNADTLQQPDGRVGVTPVLTPGEGSPTPDDGEITAAPVFTPNASNTAGTFTWTVGSTPGTYTFQFVAANALTGTCATTITVTDRAPVVTAPSSVNATPGSTVSFTVTASDPDGQAIQSFTMVPVSMPANHGAVFTTNAARTQGTFTWVVGSTTGTFSVRFVAANALSGSATTTIRVKAKGRKDAGEAEEEGEGMPRVLALSNAFPNPSRGAVELALDLPEASDVRWAVFDLQGRMVWSEEQSLAAGHARLRWSGLTTAGERAATGIYLVRAWVGGAAFSRRIVRL